MTRAPIISAIAVAAMLSAPVAHANDLLKGAVGVAIGAGIFCGVTGKCGTQQNAAPQQAAPKAQSGVSSAQREQNRQVQTALNTFGFPVGTPDGALGPKSRAGISNYQNYMGYQPTGYLEPYQQQALLDSYNRVQAGAGAAYPEVIAQEGIQGLLKAFADPNYVNKYRQPQVPPQPPFNGVQMAAQPQVPQVVTPQAAPEPQPSLPQTAAALPQLAPLPLITETSVSMAERCEVVALMTQTNQGLMMASNLTDADQALSEQFCEARGYAITVGQTMISNVRLPEDQLVATCGQITDSMKLVMSGLGSATPQDTAGAAAEINAQLGVGDPKAAATYGQICMGVGYRQDEADIAAAGSLMLVGAGFMPYGEMIGHHQREGFGTDRNAPAAAQWYTSALDALDQNESPAFLPSKSRERAAIIRAAMEMGDLRADAAASLPRIIPVAAHLPVLDAQ